MKKIIFLFVLTIAGTLIFGHQKSKEKELTGKEENPLLLDEVNNIRSSKIEKVPESMPRILFLLNKESGQNNWSPYLWWNYQHSKPRQDGC